jgi:hypothetical protein
MPYLRGKQASFPRCAMEITYLELVNYQVLRDPLLGTLLAMVLRCRRDPKTVFESRGLRCHCGTGTSERRLSLLIIHRPASYQHPSLAS